MSHTKRMVVGGVDTHSATHHPAIVDEQGRLLGDAEFPATPNGYAQLLSLRSEAIDTHDGAARARRRRISSRRRRSAAVRPRRRRRWG